MVLPTTRHIPATLHRLPVQRQTASKISKLDVFLWRLPYSPRSPRCIYNRKHAFVYRKQPSVAIVLQLRRSAAYGGSSLF